MTSWSIKRSGAGKFTPGNVDPALCTHVIFAFGTLKDSKLTFVDGKDAEQYKEMTGLREKNANLKVRERRTGFSGIFYHIEFSLTEFEFIRLSYAS